MTNEIVKREAGGIDIWKKPDEIRKLFAANLNDSEWKFFLGMSKITGANPFKREIWAVKYDKNKPANIFLGRDFYRKTAQKQKDYNGHSADVVYSNDEFSVENGRPIHKYNLKDRGHILGAYGIAYKKGVEIPFFNYVDFAEYNLKQSVWNAKPATMIKKVGEAQVLRMAWQDVFGGTYDESENWNNNETKEPVKDYRKVFKNPIQEPPQDEVAKADPEVDKLIAYATTTHKGFKNAERWCHATFGKPISELTPGDYQKGKADLDAFNKG